MLPSIIRDVKHSEITNNRFGCDTMPDQTRSWRKSRKAASNIKTAER